MANMSDFLENMLVRHVLAGATFTKPTTLAVALCSGIPHDTHTGATLPELQNAGGYVRWSIGAPADGHWVFSPTSGNVENASGWVWPVASALWGWVSGVAILDSATIGAGNVLIHGSLTTSKYVTQNDQFTMPSGYMDISFQ